MQRSLESYIHQQPLPPSERYPIPAETDIDANSTAFGYESYDSGNQSVEEKNEYLVTTRNNIELLSSILNATSEPKAIKERVVALRQQRLEEQDDNVGELDESQVFIEAAAGKRSDRIYGIGSVAGLYSDNSGATSAPPPSAEYAAQLEQQVENLQEHVGSL